MKVDNHFGLLFSDYHYWQFYCKRSC